MVCPGAPPISDNEFFRQLSHKAIEQRIPLTGGIDLTCLCNLRCVHCYVGPQACTEGSGGREMATGLIFDIVDQITDAGCLFVVVTGGEPLLRKDFIPIYRHMKAKGLLVTVFTNATLINEEIATLFAELPPYSIEVSIYGATEETAQKITGMSGALKKCLNGIDLLLEYGVKHVQLKTILMTLNRHEFYDMEKIALDRGLEFRMDAAIFPRFNGDKTPLDLRVSPEEAVEKVFSVDKRVDDMIKYFERSQDLPGGDNLYVCGAGITSFHIDAYGNLLPCVMPAGIKYSLLTGSFADGWNKVINDIINRKAGAFYKCNDCEKMALCGFCPAFFRLETGSEDIRSDYLCAMGRSRFDFIYSGKRTGGLYGE